MELTRLTFSGALFIFLLLITIVVYSIIPRRSYKFEDCIMKWVIIVEFVASYLIGHVIYSV
jgi:hypothetical protein